DVAVEAGGRRKEVTVDELPTDYLILDIGAVTAEEYAGSAINAKSIVVSGPL
ncbi:MAG: phosphoglycerate kinase, partial [Candidatus Thorarchaeota archaeon]|nr:phosphoglycerate kinase [Candidatus Thorarchaeota archaeon]